MRSFSQGGITWNVSFLQKVFPFEITPLKTNKYPLKIDGWVGSDDSFPLRMDPLQGTFVHLLGGICCSSLCLCQECRDSWIQITVKIFSQGPWLVALEGYWLGVKDLHMHFCLMIFIPKPLVSWMFWSQIFTASCFMSFFLQLATFVCLVTAAILDPKIASLLMALCALLSFSAVLAGAASAAPKTSENATPLSWGGVEISEDDHFP